MFERELLEKGYKKYTGEKIDVFEVGRRPWVMPDAAEAGEVAEVIDRCPSKALQHILK